MCYHILALLLHDNCSFGDYSLLQFLRFQVLENLYIFVVKEKIGNCQEGIYYIFIHFVLLPYR